MKFSKTATAAFVSVALCFSSTSASAAACQAGPAGSAGCVLPVGEAAPVQVQTPAPVAPAYVAPEVAGGFNFLPILLGLAALTALYFLVIKDNDKRPKVSP
jgi:hypothetical protein